MLRHLKDICTVAKKNNIKVIYCHHFIPGSEGFSYGSIEEVLYNLYSSKDIFDKSKKWLINITKPLSTKFIHKTIKNKYEIPYLECDKLVVFTKPYIYRYLNIINEKDEQKFKVIPNPLSFSEFLPKEKLQFKNKEVIFVGRLYEAQKRVSTILKIWKFVEKEPLLNDWTLKIIGEGKDESFLKWLTKRYQLKRVSFEGRQDPKPYYNKASIMLSTSAYEGWPMVLMEAMPMGCCCLAFDSYDAVHDIITDGIDGRIIPNNNIKAYYKALSELMLNDDKRIAMMQSAIESSKRFSMEIVGEKWRELLAE
ncbi:MAG: glycosyltransferase [Paludibacteraceae bacterium]|nr:glycosyltransferase [Paludibacteraceae bacterium]